MKKMYHACLLLSGLVSTALMAQNDKSIPPQLTEFWKPVPKVVNPTPIPSDAIVLFDGTNLDQWQHKDGSPVKWTLKDGIVTVKPKAGPIVTKQKFCDVQLHVEWRSPEFTPDKTGQNAGNSGIFLQSRYEIQVLNSYNNPTYSNGQAGSVYKQSIPLVNASKPPMQWQEYDIIFNAPKYNKAGELTDKAHVTVLHNGVLIQNHTEIQGHTVYRGKASYPPAYDCAPILLQDHNELVSYRNIWVRPISKNILTGMKSKK